MLRRSRWIAAIRRRTAVVSDRVATAKRRPVRSRPGLAAGAASALLAGAITAAVPTVGDGTHERSTLLLMACAVCAEAVRTRRTPMQIADPQRLAAAICCALAAVCNGAAAGVAVALAANAVSAVLQPRATRRAALGTAAAAAAAAAAAGYLFAALVQEPRDDVGALLALALVTPMFAAIDFGIGLALGAFLTGTQPWPVRPLGIAVGLAYMTFWGTVVGLAALSGSVVFAPLAVGMLVLSLRQQRRLDAGRAHHLMIETVAAEERERRALAKALHDEAIQSLLAARQDLDEGATTRARIAVSRAVDQLRDTLYGLHPAMLQHAGLARALRELATHLGEREGLAVAIRVDPAATGREDRDLYAIARELLTNAAKHSGGHSIDLRLEHTADSHIVLQVRDDGRGMDPRRAIRSPTGLAAIAQRLERLDGTIHLASPPDGGSMVTVRLPATVNGIPDRRHPIG